MHTKEEIRNNPWFVMIYTQRHFDNWKLYIKIELTNQKNDLFLLPPKKGMWIGEGHSFHDYDDKGRYFFNDLMENFGRAWVMIPEGKPIEFDSYEALLNKITSD